MTNTPAGRIIHISGPIVEVTGLAQVRLFDVVLIGEERLIGEVIRLNHDVISVQVYENTSGLRIGEPAWSTGHPLAVQLGPGLLGQVYDGLQRPLYQLGEVSGNFLKRGMTASALSETQQWAFQPLVQVGVMVTGGTVIGIVPETNSLDHRILVPPLLQGEIIDINEGRFTINETIAVIKTRTGTQPLTLAHQWSVRIPRPYQQKLTPNVPVITGTRVIDTLFPIARGGSAIIPGGFGTGKTVIQQSLARWSDVDVVVYVGCGERGNEMTEVLDEFPQLHDPRTGATLMARTILIANTSDMPVAAREASIYTGITLAEYYRDMGYHVLMLADSTSRWGEALREISGRMEEIPGEEGYPAYLGSRLSEFYERSGAITCSGSATEQRTGSVTIIGAVSPPGGDFSEPMTQNSMRVIGTYWGLDYDLSRRRHFPAISWMSSFSLYHLQNWFKRDVQPDWHETITLTQFLLQREAELEAIVQLVGPDALSDHDKLILFVARMLREDFLQQSALDEIDQYSPIQKTYAMLKAILTFYHGAHAAINSGTSLEVLTTLPQLQDLARMKRLPHAKAVDHINDLIAHLNAAFERDERVNA